MRQKVTGALISDDSDRPACERRSTLRKVSLLTHHLLGMVLNEDKNSGAVLSHFVDAVSNTDEQLLERLDQLVKAKRRALRRSE